jgi:hypothetical protein
VNVFDEQREQRTEADGTPLADEDQTGVTVSMSWELGSRTELSVSANRADRQYDELTGEREFKGGSIRAVYALGPRTDVSLEYDRHEEASKSGTAGVGYRANLIALRLTRTFSDRR